MSDRDNVRAAQSSLPKVVLTFDGGTLAVRHWPSGLAGPSGLQWDVRTSCHRAPAVDYAAIVMCCIRAGVPYDDRARGYDELAHGLSARQEPRDYQQAALDAWYGNRGRGVVVLPTGAGKTYVAEMAIDKTRRSTLVVAPTLDLVAQWHNRLKADFAMEVGVVGGGAHKLAPLTVTTYDSAHIHMDSFGDRFGLVVFDECHHLPGDAYLHGALACLAPFRLGLTATPERSDGREAELGYLIGRLVYRRSVTELRGDYLANYTTHRIAVELSFEERQAYEEARAIYRGFVVSQGIRISRPGGWNEFIMRSARSEAGRRAMEAYQRQRRLSFAAPSKLEYLEHLLHQHRRDRVLIFTLNNATAYEISRRFLVPVITHQTKVKERAELLEGFSAGRYTALVTSKVLNEGVDVPDANVAVVISGTGSVREHVQRLGRVLRKKGDKHAHLYELVAAGTAEQMTSERRREHSAYGGGTDEAEDV